MDAEIKKVAIYTRVSTEDQAKEGFSLDAQLDKLRSYCKARDWEICREYIDDGYSGRYIKRPAYKKMMEEMDQWDALLVIKMDRIHRNSKNFMLMMEHLKQKEKEFVSMTESLDTSTAMGRFVMDIIQRIAQLESEQIGERVYVGMEQKAKTNGGVLGFNIPYGYDYKDGKLIIKTDEAKIVKEIFESYLDNKGLKKISDTLNKKNVNTKHGKTWAAQTISLILKNPVYCGFLHWEKHLNPGDHESIINNQTFNKVQKIIRAKSHKKNLELFELSEQ